MRDIRNDLRERLASLEAQQYEVMADYKETRDRLDANYKDAIAAIDGERAAIKQLLRIEESRASALPFAIGPSSPTVPLQDFLIAKAQSTTGPLSKDELRAAAEEAGYADGRAFHTTLMNITKGGRLHQLKDGRYVIPPLGCEPLFNIEEGEDEMRLAN